MTSSPPDGLELITAEDTAYFGAIALVDEGIALGLPAFGEHLIAQEGEIKILLDGHLLSGCGIDYGARDALIGVLAGTDVVNAGINENKLRGACFYVDSMVSCANVHDEAFVLLAFIFSIQNRANRPCCITINSLDFLNRKHASILYNFFSIRFDVRIFLA